MKTKNNIAFITGASSGIGKETALLFYNAGYKVYAAARRIDKMKDLEAKGISTLHLDITIEESIQNCVNTILEEEGRIDILVNNAGYGSFGSVEDVPLEEGRRQFDVNIFGLARLTQLILPVMRKHQFGKIVNISSMGGKVFTPFGAWYHATKYALEGWTDCLRVEVKDFGIDAILIEPGGIKTEWGVITAENLRKTSGHGAYAETTNKHADGIEKAYLSNQLTAPEVIAKTILKAVKARKTKRRYVKGIGAAPSIFIRKWFGDGVYEKFLKMVN